MIEVVNVTKRFGGLVAVNKMNIVVEKSEILGLIGPNGGSRPGRFAIWAEGPSGTPYHAADLSAAIKSASVSGLR